MYEEKTIETKEIFRGKVIDLKVDTVTLPNGHHTQRELISHSGGCAVVVNHKGDIVFVRQYRKSIETHLLELPAGKLDPNEDIATCALRELQEETGLIAENMVKIGLMYPTPGYSNEVIHLYYADKLREGTVNRDEDEFMDVIRIPVNKISEMIAKGEIIDGKTLTALLLCRKELKL
ncbi:MAG: NUDIX hydrolase [Eubacteriaceae bacterium]|nr:NUDIX hydrolase [Eubacteriaceae bacterium]